jgi:hypothetical protein
MPLKPENRAVGYEERDLCQSCINPNGVPKSYEEVLSGMAKYFVESKSVHPKAARDYARQTIEKLPYWKQRRK